MKINARQLNLYAVTDRSWLEPGETLVTVTEELPESRCYLRTASEKNICPMKRF